MQSVHFSLYLYKGTCELSFSLSIIACVSSCYFLIGPYYLLLVFLALKVHTFQKEIRGGLHDLVWTWGCSRPAVLSFFSICLCFSPRRCWWGSAGVPVLCKKRACSPRNWRHVLSFAQVCVHLCTSETGSLGKTAKGRLKRMYRFTAFFDRTILGGKLFLKQKSFCFKHGLYLVFHIHVILQIRL